jgi:hypothetical protein
LHRLFHNDTSQISIFDANKSHVPGDNFVPAPLLRVCEPTGDVLPPAFDFEQMVFSVAEKK